MIYLLGRRVGVFLQSVEGDDPLIRGRDEPFIRTASELLRIQIESRQA
jgi:hypothetical protein